MTISKKQLSLWFGLSIIVIGLDQWTKILADNKLSYGLPVEVLPVFNLTLQYNTGAAWSFLSDAGGWQRWLFTGIAIVVSIAIVIWMTRLKEKEQLLAAGLCLILGGAIGNVIDRILYGHVVDFISLHYQGWYFPAFNIADAAITIGAACLILDMFIHPENHR